MMSGFVVAVGGSCPIHVQLRWVDVAQGLDSKPNVDVVVVVVVIDAANHANNVFAILSVDALATFHPVDDVACSDVIHLLCDVAIQLSNMMLLDVGVVL